MFLKSKVNKSLSFIFKIGITFCCAMVLAIVSFSIHPWAALALFVGIAVIYLCLQYDLVFWTALFVFVCQVINSKYIPMLSFGGISLHAGDVLLLVGFGKLLLRRMKGKKVYFGGALGKTILLFYGYLLLEVFLGFFHFNIDLNVMLQLLRIMSYYLFFLIFINMISKEKDLQRFFKMLEWLSVVVCVNVILQIIFRDTFSFLAGRIEDVSTLGHVSRDITRISTEGMAISGVVFIYEVAKACIQPKQFKLFNLIVLLFAIMIMGISFYRSSWISNSFSLCLMFFLLSNRERQKFLIKGFGILALCVVLIVVAGSVSPKIRAYEKAMTERVLSLFDTQRLLSSGSLSIRAEENRYAMKKVKESPWVGIGMGKEYRPVKYYVTDNRAWIHNGFYAIILNFGLIGAFLYFFIYLKSLFQLFLGIRDRDVTPIEKTVYMTAFLVSLKFFITGGLGPGFVRQHVVIFIAVFWGCAILAREKLLRKELESNS